MSEKLSSLTRKIALGALSAVYAQSVQANEQGSGTPTSDDFDHLQELSAGKTNTLELRLKLKPSDNPDKWELIAHRSHRSHSSHRSHYSSRSGGNSSASGTSRSSSGSSTKSYPSQGSSSSGIYGNTSHSLGSRLLKLGMHGEDVTELMRLLISKGYYALPSGHTLKVKELYDIIVQEAVKEFQRDRGLTIDGSVGPVTLYHLKYN